MSKLDYRTYEYIAKMLINEVGTDMVKTTDMTYHQIIDEEAYDEAVEHQIRLLRHWKDEGVWE